MLRKMNNELRIFLLLIILRGLNLEQEHQYIKNYSTSSIENPTDIINNHMPKITLKSPW